MPPGTLDDDGNQLAGRTAQTTPLWPARLLEQTSIMNAGKLKKDLLAMRAEDLRVRAELAADGSLFDGYHPRMRELHERNAARLLEILATHGWPGRSLVGNEAAEAAWLVLQHAIGNPPLQRRGLVLLRAAAAIGEVPAIQVAMLEDRIRGYEGRGQIYGTEFDWDEQGLLSPLPIEDELHVDERRLEVGLIPLAQDIEQRRLRTAQGQERPPQDWAARQREKERWLRSVGWRE